MVHVPSCAVVLGGCTVCCALAWLFSGRLLPENTSKGAAINKAFTDGAMSALQHRCFSFFGLVYSGLLLRGSIVNGIK